MTNEENELLLKDLCARLPHKQKVCYKIHDNSEEIIETLSGCLLDYFKTGKIAVVKPYLRPMNSMTEKEKNEWMDITHAQEWLIIGNLDKATDWLNAHHFDYRDLIEKGLALEAPEGMYK